MEKINKRIQDTRTKKRIHEHLSNKNDLITEEDLRSIKTNFEEEDGSVNFFSKQEKAYAVKKNDVVA